MLPPGRARLATTRSGSPSPAITTGIVLVAFLAARDAGVPRVTYHNMPFQIFQGEGDLLMVYPFAAANRVIYTTDRS